MCKKFISESRAKLFCAVTRDRVSENDLVQQVPRGSAWEDEWEGGRVKNVFQGKLGCGMCLQRAWSTGGTGDKQTSGGAILLSRLATQY